MCEVPSDCVLVCVSVSSHEIPAMLSLSHWALEHHVGGDFSQAPPVMAQLYFYCKISIIPSVQGTSMPPPLVPPACLCHSEQSPCLGCTGPSTEKTADHRSSDDLCRALFPWIHELYCNRDTEDQDRGLALNPKDLFQRTAGPLHAYMAHQYSHAARDFVAWERWV